VPRHHGVGGARRLAESVFRSTIASRDTGDDGPRKIFGLTVPPARGSGGSGLCAGLVSLRCSAAVVFRVGDIDDDEQHALPHTSRRTLVLAIIPARDASSSRRRRLSGRVVDGTRRYRRLKRSRVAESSCRSSRRIRASAASRRGERLPAVARTAEGGALALRALCDGVGSCVGAAPTGNFLDHDASRRGKCVPESWSATRVCEEATHAGYLDPASRFLSIRRYTRAVDHEDLDARPLARHHRGPPLGRAVALAGGIVIVRLQPPHGGERVRKRRPARGRMRSVRLPLLRRGGRRVN
jgi:hypothetical protein